MENIKNSSEISEPSGKAYQFVISPRLQRLSFILIAVGIVAALLQWIFPWHAPESHVIEAGAGHAVKHINPRFFVSTHLALLFAIPLSLGGIYFTALHFLTGSSWSVSLRRLAENFFWYLPVILLLMVIVFIGADDVFHHWLQAPADDHLIELKKPWLNFEGLVSRNLLWLVLWFILGFLIWKHSISEDRQGSLLHRKHLKRYSAIFMVVFALTYSMNSWDFSLSLEPHWFSTLWAVYSFAGFVLTLYAALVLWTWYLRRQGFYGGSLNENHLHDLSKFLWGFSIFWAYMAISQYMLIWYAGIPEEMYYYKLRNDGAWWYVTITLTLLRFVAPFLLIIKRDTKRSWNKMALFALLILVGQVWDLYWMIYPTMVPKGDFVFLSWQELGMLSFVIGSYILVVAKALRRHSLVPLKDPDLDKCVNFHQ